jgi:uncharacterized protein (TIGR02448 family)
MRDTLTVSRCFGAGSGPGIALALSLAFGYSSLMGFLSKLLFTPLLAMACWTGSAQAFDAFNLSTQGTVVSGYATSKVTSAPFDHKLLLAAHDDAAAFIASDGQLRGAQLESALHYLRRTQPKLHASDLELAQAILVQ